MIKRLKRRYKENLQTQVLINNEEQQEYLNRFGIFDGKLTKFISYYSSDCKLFINIEQMRSGMNTHISIEVNNGEEGKEMLIESITKLLVMRRDLESWGIDMGLISI